MCLCCCLWLQTGYVWGERSPPPPHPLELCKRDAAPAQPATAGLDAETCIQTKKGGRGEARGELEPPESGRARASCSPPHRGFD